jgi:hypothetical protein
MKRKKKVVIGAKTKESQHHNVNSLLIHMVISCIPTLKKTGCIKDRLRSEANPVKLLKEKN